MSVCTLFTQYIVVYFPIACSTRSTYVSQYIYEEHYIYILAESNFTLSLILLLLSYYSEGSYYNIPIGSHEIS